MTPLRNSTIARLIEIILTRIRSSAMRVDNSGLNLPVRERRPWRVIYSFIMIVDGHRQRFLCVLLSDDVPIQVFQDLKPEKQLNHDLDESDGYGIPPSAQGTACVDSVVRVLSDHRYQLWA